MRINYILLFVLFSLFIINEGFSQSSFYNEYGKNRIQNKSFDWKILSSENFDIYYNNEGKRNAEISIKHLENNFNSITNIIGHFPTSKTKIFIYNSEADFNQSNIGINEKEIYLTSNVQNNIKLEFTTFFPGTVKEFQSNLTYEFSNSLIVDMMNSGLNFTQKFSKSSYVSLPLWFTKGASKYVANGWDQKMDNYIRDYFLISDFRKIAKVTENHAPYIGQSIWNYIINTYGRSSLSNILNLTKIIKNTGRSIESTLGISFESLMENWQTYYINDAKQLVSQYQLPNKENEVKHNKNHINSINTILSPESDQVLYSIKEYDRYKIYVKDLKSDKIRKLGSGNFKSNKNNYPILKWIDNNKVAYLTYKKGKNTLYIYDLLDKRKEIKLLDEFDYINEINFNSTSNLFIISAVSKGSSNIYLLSTYKNYKKKITNDNWDDIDPIFIPNEDIILFSSNRDNIYLDNRDDYKINNEINDNYNIFLFHLDTTETILKQITKTVSKDTKPLARNNNEIYYLSNIKGITNLFKYDLTNESYIQVSNFFSDILNYKINFKNNNIILSMINEGVIKNYYYENYNLESKIFTLETNRKKFLIKKNLVNKKISLETITNEKAENNSKDFEKTENFIFKDEEGKLNNKNASSIISNYKRLQKNSTAFASYDYKYSIVKNNFNTFLAIDPIKKFGTQIETDIIDLFENHRLYGKVFVPFSNLKSGDIFVEYSFLANRIDYKIGFNRKIIELDNEEEFLYHRYKYNSIFISSSYPLSRYSRIEISPFYLYSKFNDLDYRVLNSTSLPYLTQSSNRYLGFKTNFTFDNTNKIGMNLEQGTKMKFELKKFNSSNNNNNFNNISIDIQHFQKIHKQITLATKFYYGKFFGNNPKNYLLGGIKNSLFGNNSENKGSDDPLKINSGYDNSNILFSEFYNLRGYNFNKFHGNEILALTTELRIPIIKYLFNRQISSSFLENLQLVSFFDIGSSWTGKSPFNTENNINIWIINEPGSVFEAEIVNSKNPWLSSFGWGLRSLIMDYYIKIDFSKPIEDYKVGKPKLHFSIGYSF